MDTTRQLIDNLRGRLENEPDNTELLVQLADAFKCIGDNYSARACYRRVLELNDIHGVSWFNLGSTEYNLKQFDEAQICFTKATEINGESGWTWLRLGDTYREMNQPAQAMECYNRAIAIEDTSEWALLSLGDLNREQQNMARAVGYYEQAVQTNGNFLCAIAALTDSLLYEQQSYEYPDLGFAW